MIRATRPGRVDGEMTEPQPMGLRIVPTLLLVTTVFAWFVYPAAAQLLPEPDPREPEPATPAEMVIPADDDAGPTDEAIRSRILSLFSRIDELAGIDVQVEGGVVSLSGTASNQQARERALELAERVEGTIMVIDAMDSDVSVQTRFGAAMDSLESRLLRLLSLSPLLVLALLIVALSLFIARLAGRAERAYRAISPNSFVRELVRQLVQVVIVITGIVLALMLLDATALLGSIAGALGILGLAIGFATRDTVENYIASILLSLRQPFRYQDYVRIDDIEGRVLRLTSRATVLMSLDGNHIRIPNAKVYKATIVNFTRNPLRRFEFRVGVDTELDLAQPRSTALQTLATLPAVLDDPEPVCLVEALGDSSIILLIQGWVDQREHDLNKTRSEAQRLVKEAFDEAGIVMPEPIYNVNLRRGKPRVAATIEARPEPGAEHEPDTGRDLAVEEQMRADPDARHDLLDPEAPSE